MDSSCSFRLVILSAVVLIFIASSATACDRCLNQTKVSFFFDDKPLQTGACGYGSLATGLNTGRLAAAAPFIYKNGAGCGACFQMRCKIDKICSKEGTTFTVTDLNTNNQTGFVLSRKAFVGMANSGSGSAQQLLKLGIADVEYKRIPCVYKNNLTVRVEESSQKPYYLAVKILYQGGQTEIVIVDVAKVGTSNWGSLSRNHGAVWDTSMVPNGPVQFRFTVTAGYDGKQYWAKYVLPPNWANGGLYDTGLQINDIAQEGCWPCDNSTWKSRPIHLLT